MVHIFNTSYKKLNLDMTYSQMEAKTNEAIDKARKTVVFFNSAKVGGFPFRWGSQKNIFPF